MMLAFKNLSDNSGKRQGAGYTLIELLVAMSIFAVVVTIVGGVFIQALKMQRRAMNFQQIEENASLLLEAMAKEIRVSEIQGDDGCSAQISMKHPIYGYVTYTLSGNELIRVSDDRDAAESMSSNTIQFTNMRFCLEGMSPADNRQPRVRISAQIQSTNPNERALVDVQTTVSQRFVKD